MERQFLRLDQMTTEDLRQHMLHVRDLMAPIAALPDPSDADEDEFYRLRDRFYAAEEMLKAREERAAMRDQLNGGHLRTEVGAFGSQSANQRPAGGRPGPARHDSRARAVVDALHNGGQISERQAEALTGTLARGDARQQAEACRYVEAAGSPAYLRAVLHLMRDPMRGHLSWGEDEAAAWRQAEAWRTEQRAMGEGVDTTGGYLVPTVLDPALILTDGTTTGQPSPLRAACRVVTTAASAYRAATTDGVTAGFRAELAEVPETDPTLAELSIPVHALAVYVEASYELLMDAPTALSQLQRIMAEARINRESQAFVSGTGTGEPRGLVTALAANAGSLESLAGTSLAAGDFRTLVESVPRRWAAGSRWLAPTTVLDQVALFEDLAGGRMAESVSASGTILRRPVTEVPDLAGAGVATAGTDVLVVGDTQQYVIVDRLGATMEVTPTSVTGANRRPILARGFTLWSRVGADLLVPDALHYAEVPA